MHITRMNAGRDAAGQLGFWGELLTAGLQAGASVYNTKQNTKLQTEQIRQQTEALKAQLENDRKARELQVQLASMNAVPVGAAPPLTLPPGVTGTPQLVPAPNGGYNVVLDPGPAPLPAWAIPAAIGGGVLVLVLLLRR